jgi:Tfp pilus assembly protein PilX
MSRARSEQGSALMMAVIILFIALGIGAALMATAISQKRESSNQQRTESAYSLAEAALNAQIYQLTLQWPTSNDASQPSSSPNLGYPTSCNAASNGTSYCPSSSDLAAAYPTTSGTCPSGTQGDAWSSSSSVKNGWTTYVRDAGTSTSPTASTLFGSATEENAAPYDLTGSANPAAGGFLWVRAVGVVNCHMAVLITKVADQIIGLNFPKYVLNANSFTISDTGNKDVLNTGDVSGTTQVASQISLRCDGEGGLPPNSTCAGVQNPSQIAPTTSYATNPAPSPTLSASQLAAAKALAIEDGTYIPSSTDCTTITASQLQGQVVYVEGNSNCYGNGGINIQSNSVFNSFSSPGLLIIANGTLAFKGNSTFYGIIYAANQANYSGTVVYLGGTTTVIGGVAVDGSGQLALNLGSSGNGAVACTDTGFNNKCGDLEYDANAFNGLVGFAGAAPVPNTFRQLPNSQ